MPRGMLVGEKRELIVDVAGGKGPGVEGYFGGGRRLFLQPGVFCRISRMLLLRAVEEHKNSAVLGPVKRDWAQHLWGTTHQRYGNRALPASRDTQSSGWELN